jgi:hypothetical protein
VTAIGMPNATIQGYCDGQGNFLYELQGEFDMGKTDKGFLTINYVLSSSGSTLDWSASGILRPATGNNRTDDYQFVCTPNAPSRIHTTNLH